MRYFKEMYSCREEMKSSEAFLSRECTVKVDTFAMLFNERTPSKRCAIFFFGLWHLKFQQILKGITTFEGRGTHALTFMEVKSSHYFSK